mgnify:CR=1 FL=1
MYTREEILNTYKEIPFPKQLLEESSLSNINILFHSKSKKPLSSITKDTSSLSQSFVLPWRILQQKNNNKNIEFSRGGSFTPSEPLIEIKIENFKKIYEKFEIPLDKKIIYLKKGNNISGPYNYDELEKMYKEKKIDSNYEFRTIDLFSYSEEEPFIFHSIKNINEDNWEQNYVESPLIEYTPLYLRVKALLEASKKRKVEVTTLDKEITELKSQNELKDNKINELNEKIEQLEKELSEQKNTVKELNEKENERIKQQENEMNKDENKEDKEEDKKTEKEENNIIEKEEVIEVVEKNFLYSSVNKKKKKKKKKEEVKEIPNEEEEEKEEIIEKEKIEIEYKPKVLDMGEEWEVAGKKKKKIEKIKEEPKVIVKKEEPKKANNDISKTTGSNKSKKNQISGEELVEMLRPKKKEIIKNEVKNDGEKKSVEVKQVKGKGKKKVRRQYEEIDIDLKYK